MKYHQYLQILIYIKVTSYTEVWIEIKEDFTKLENRLKVTSYTEVWIEITETTKKYKFNLSHLLYGGVD